MFYGQICFLGTATAFAVCTSKGNLRDKLLQWSYVATGIAITWCIPSEILSTDREFRYDSKVDTETTTKEGA